MDGRINSFVRRNKNKIDMKSLWFKQIYVKDILDGKKTYTIRKPDCKPFAIGERISLQVGPRKPFAEVIVTGFLSIRSEQLGSRLASVQKIYGVHSAYRQLCFKVVRVFDECPEVIKSRTMA